MVMEISRRLGRGPLLYQLVFLTSVSLIAFSALTLAMLGRDHAMDGSIQVAVADDQATIRGFVATYLTPIELETGVVSQERQAIAEAWLGKIVRDYAFLDIVVLSPGMGVILSATSQLGAAVTVSQRTIESTSRAVPDAQISDQDGGARTVPVLTEVIPVLQGDDLRLLFQIRRDASPILARADDAWRNVLIVTVSAAIVLAVLLYVIFRAANVRLLRQEDQLAEAQRRDPLTGLLNHGAGVAVLTDLLEAARRDNESVGIALIDLDTFRLLNEVHGSRIGDQALAIVAGTLREKATRWPALARFGPDEFLAIAPRALASDIPAVMERLRAGLEATCLELSPEDRLPISVSVGIAYFPLHAASVTDLMSAATLALSEAKAAGGNRICTADTWAAEPRAPHSTFDALQGLVIAIDGKDRYTKLHSEDVAAYAVFLGELVGLPDEMNASLRVAGLLHDVGKIGIPDAILRKPGRLTPHEYEIVKHHVALGDSIVRDLPAVDLIRSGVRYHHERWDGQGYMVGLAGDDIPLIARILAVGDAFSAMTTSRPYRKAMSIERALAELRAAAGTQLDAALVDAFVSGIEQDPNAPMPGADRNPKALWTPGRRAA